MTNQSIHNLNQCEIERFIKNPLPPPIEFTDRTQNGDFGLLPVELWNHIYDIKHSMEKHDIVIAGDKQDKQEKTIKENEILHFKWFASEPDLLTYNSLKKLFNDSNQNEKYNIERWFGDIEIYGPLGIEINNLTNGDKWQFLDKVIKQKRPRKNKVELFNRVFREQMTNSIDILRRSINGEFFYNDCEYEKFTLLESMKKILTKKYEFLDKKYKGSRLIKYDDIPEFRNNNIVIRETDDFKDIKAEYYKRSHNPIFQESFRSGVY